MDEKEKARRLVEEEILPGYRKEFGDEIYFNLFTQDKIEALIDRLAEYEKNKNQPIPVKTDVPEEFRSCSYEHLLAVLNQYEHGYDIAGGVSRDAINRAEKASGYRFPTSFKEYLAVFGCMNIGDSHRAGITDDENIHELFWITDLCKEQHGLPDGYLCLEYDHYLSYTTCIDLQSGQGDNAPVYWYLFNERRFDGVEAINFDIHFRNDVATTISVNRKNSNIQ
jgi:hypothetical protein